jgi:protein involved in polysaccharide export with SLBB domain
MTFKNLLKLSGGLEDSTYTKSVYLEKAEIIRRNPGSRYDEVISVKLGKILNNDTEKKIVLHNLDRVVVHANSNFFEKEHVQILGEVNIPGSYPLISDNETLQSVLNRAGNFTSKAMKDGIAIYRDRKYFEVTASQATLLSDGEDGEDGEDREDGKVRVAWQNVSVTLMPGDSVVVKESPGTVNVFGQVYNSGLIEFRTGKGLKYYIDGAGGVTEQGNKKSIIVVYANGVVSPNKWYSTPKIEDGATIIVNKKPSSEPFNPTEFASTLASFLSSIVTIMVLSKQL